MIKPINRDDDKYEYIELSADEELPEGFEFVDDDDMLLDDLLKNQNDDTLDASVDDVSLDSLFDDSDADVGELLEQPIEQLEQSEISDADTQDMVSPLAEQEDIVEKESKAIVEDIKSEVSEIKEIETSSSSVFMEKSLNITQNSGFVVSDATEFVLQLENEDDLKNWQLLIWTQKAVSMPKDKGEMSLNAAPNKANFVTLFQEGKKKMALFNSPKISWHNASSEWQHSDTSFVFGNMEEVKGLLMDELERHSPLQPKAEFPTSRALLFAPDVCCVFSNLQKYKVNYLSSSVEDKASQNYLRWFSGSLSDKYHEYSLSSNITEIIGDDEKDTLYISIASSLYGWNIKFDNNIFMSLLDVQEFQRRNGRLPDNSGVISYGAHKLSFRRINRIIAGRGRAHYFSYIR